MKSIKKLNDYKHRINNKLEDEYQVINKKILLFEPGTKLTKFPPLGLIELGAFLRKEGFQVMIEDYSGLDINEHTIEELINKFNPFIVGVRILTGPHISRGLKISKIAKKLKKIVVWGGPHPTILPKQTLENKNIDAVVIGEGEYAFIDLIQFISGNKNIIPLGCGIKTNNQICIFPPQNKIYDLNNAPIPAWDLLRDINRYFPEKKHNTLPISTTRGCPFRCGFCHNSNTNVKKYLGIYRITNPSKVIEQYKFVQSLVKNKIDSLDLGEDLHLVNKSYAKKFCKTIKESNLKLNWHTSARFDAMDLEICDLITNAGCKRIFFGIESGSQRIQKLINKPIELNHAKKICNRLIKNGIIVTNTYIFGHPTETIEELNMTFEFLKKIPASENLIQIYRPLPATPYFELCKQLGKDIIIPNKLEDWENFAIFGSEKNFSKIEDKILMKYYFLFNLKEQIKCFINLERHYLNRKMYTSFIKAIYKNKFIYKIEETARNIIK